jgi:hypothetical protein
MPVTDYRDLLTEYASMCTWRWHCPGDPDLTIPEDCKRASPRGECKMFTPNERDWREVGVRIRRMRSTPEECAGAKAIMLGYYAAGPKSGGINFWRGHRLRFNSDSSYRMNSPGVFSTIVGHPLDYGVAYERDVFMTSQRAVAHEPLHVYIDAHPDLSRLYGDSMEAHIGHMDRQCGGA